MADNKPFQGSPDQSDNLANQGNQIIEFFHVPSGFSVKFKAFLTQFDDAYSSEWTSEMAFGRMDPIQSFQATVRKISLGFDVVAASADEANSNMSRISLLLQMLYPSYDSSGGGATTLQAAPYFKLNFMNLAADTMNASDSGAENAGLLGTVDGFTFSPDLDVGFFLDKNNDAQAIPKSVNLSCTFTVLHQNQLGWTQKNQRPGFANFPYLKIPGLDDQLDTFAQQGFKTPTTERAQVGIFADSEAAFNQARADAMTAPASAQEQAAYINHQANASATQRTESERAWLKKQREKRWEKKLAERQKRIQNAGGWDES